MRIGYMLSSEQFRPKELLDQARRAHDARDPRRRAAGD